MKKLLGCLLLLCWSQVASAIHVVSKEANIDITTDKVTHIIGFYSPKLAFDVLMETVATYRIPGPRIVIIDSNGGDVASGVDIINLLLKEKDSGVDIVCVVMEKAISMGFNTFSFCDTRLATQGAKLMFHKVWTMPNPMTAWNAKKLRKLADDLDMLDKPFREKNMEALNMTDKNYDKFADAQKYWTVEELKNRYYIHGVAFVEDKPSWHPTH